MAGTIVKCIYNFEPETELDLAISVGDVIKVTNIINDEWYEGMLHGKTGQFPKAFVEVSDSGVFDVAIAVSSYEGEQDGDLSLKEGDFVVITEVVDENWSKGYTRGGSSGVFPRSFVRKVSFEDNALLASLQSMLPTSNLDAEKTEESDNVYTVVTSFNAQDANELNLFEGMKVEVLNVFDDFWLEGRLDDGKTGIFPRTCIDFPDEPALNENNSSNSDETTGKSEDLKYVVAMHDYKSDVDGDLRFLQGDKIQLLEKVDENWYKGELAGSVGLFPSNYVEIVADNSSPELEKQQTHKTPIPEQPEQVALLQNENVNKTKIVKDEDSDKKSLEMRTRESKSIKKAPPGRPNKGPPGRPPTGPKRKTDTAADTHKMNEPSTDVVVDTPTYTDTTPKSMTKKSLPPGRPKVPTSKKDALPPFSYKFTTESQPTVIIPGRYVKPGEPHVIVLRRLQESVS